MGKLSRRHKKLKHEANRPRRTPVAIARREHSQKRNGNKSDHGPKNHGPPIKRNANANASAQANVRARVPFTKTDTILLVGEGDFSFTSSLVRHHNFRSVTATCYDTKTQLLEKYPDIVPTLDQLTGEQTHDADVKSSNPSTPGTGECEKNQDISVHFGIDATKLFTYRKLFNYPQTFTKIVFNFPHVGGLSTDVNRQVRSNQILLVGFFNEAKKLLATPDILRGKEHLAAADTTEKQKLRHSEEFYGSDEEGSGPGSDESEGEGEGEGPASTCSGCILVTLFEGEPYTLWNIRDLARHCGLKVVESFKFPWAAYPGYQHARTLGVVKGKDRSEIGQRQGAWRGEERDARCFVLTLKEADGPYPAAGQGKKRKKIEDDSD